MGICSKFEMRLGKYLRLVRWVAMSGSGVEVTQLLGDRVLPVSSRVWTVCLIEMRTFEIPPQGERSPDVVKSLSGLVEDLAKCSLLG
jgi:hypothetical protein